MQAITPSTVALELPLLRLSVLMVNGCQDKELMFVVCSAEHYEVVV